MGHYGKKIGVRSVLREEKQVIDITIMKQSSRSDVYCRRSVSKFFSAVWAK